MNKTKKNRKTVTFEEFLSRLEQFLTERRPEKLMNPMKHHAKSGWRVPCSGNSWRSAFGVPSVRPA